MNLDPFLGESIQGQKYEEGEFYKSHWDYYHPLSAEYKTYCEWMGQRTWTFMIYLNNVEEAKVIKLKHTITMIENKANGSLKDIAILMDAYDSLKKNNDIDNWSEVDFEQEETAHHIRRGFELLYRNLIEYGRGKEGTLEYLQQYGVHVQLAIAEVSGYIELVNAMIESGERMTSLHLEDFLDEMKDKYSSNADKVSKRLFGKVDITNKEYMTLIEGKNK